MSSLVNRDGAWFVMKWLRGSVLLLATLMVSAVAVANPNPQDDPPKFVQDVADQLLVVLKSDPEVRKQNLERINQVVEQYMMPYMDFERTTRLAAGKYWREATPEQRQALSAAFKNTLIRTYSGAVTVIEDETYVEVLPFRGDATAEDVVVRSQLIPGRNVQPISFDYRLRRGPQGWLIYDVNVENVWLIQNYRNQFSQEINRSGIDGLIAALNERNAKN
jgi:phospholipid transport system substrate-binding protein